MHKFSAKHKLVIIYLLCIPLVPIVILTSIVGSAYENWSALFCGIGLLLCSTIVLIFSYTKAQKLALLNLRFSKIERFAKNKMLFPLYVVSAVYYIYFYTGLDVNTIFQNILIGTSNYASYQTHFADNVGGLPIAAKILPIMCGIFIKFYLLYTTLVYFKDYFYGKRRLTLIDTIHVTSVGSFYIITAMARGTFFEVLELFLLIIFGLLNFWNIRFTKGFMMKLALLVFFSFCLIYLFYLNVELRGVQRYCVTESLCLRSDAGIFFTICFILSGYFVFGIYFTGITFLVAWEKFGPWAFLFGLQETDKTELRQLVCEGVIKCGVTWHPEYSVILGAYGFLGSIFVVFFIGFIFGVIQKCWLHSQSVLYLALSYFSLLHIFSLFIGNFIFVSSSNFVLYILSVFVCLTSLRIFNVQGPQR